MGEPYFHNPDSENKVSPVRFSNDIEFFFDNKVLFERMARDILSAKGKDSFVYMANWWCDIDTPLGMSSLRKILELIAKDPLVDVKEIADSACQVCAMFWQSKVQPGQTFQVGSVGNVNPAFYIGNITLSERNKESADFISNLNSTCFAVLDNETAAAGSHHQKILIVKNDTEIISYVGSADFNLDRVFANGDGIARKKVDQKGAPEQDTHIRLCGDIAIDVLRTFVDRWKLHPSSAAHKLRSDRTSIPTTRPGHVTAQIVHTYAKNYPFKGKQITTAGRSLLEMMKSAKKYIYVEDQYLIGNAEIQMALSDALSSNVELHLIAIMTAEKICDSKIIAKKRHEFWFPIWNRYKGRVLLFEMLNSKQETDGEGSYLHSKFTLVDDAVAAVGSVNFNSRSYFHDSEISVILTVPDGSKSREKIAGLPVTLLQGIRWTRWIRHLGDEAKNSILGISDAIAAWKSLPPKALVQSWKPENLTLTPFERSLLENLIDPR